MNERIVTMYILRFPFRLRPGFDINIEDAAVFECGNHHVTLGFEDPYYVLMVADFVTEDEANEYLPNIRAGLTWLLLNRGLSVTASYDLQTVAIAEDPVQAAKNLSKSFGGVDLGRKVHGLFDGSRPAVYPADGNFKRLTPGDVSVRQTTSSLDVVRFVGEGMNVDTPMGLTEDQRLETAFDLFSASYAESSERARFLTLVMVLESLIQPSQRPDVVQRAIDHLQTHVAEQLLDLDDDSEDAFALNGLIREVDFRRQDSIRSSIRRMVLGVLAHDDDVQDVARQAVEIYDKRSRLIHDGYLPDSELAKASGDVRVLAQRILIALFNQATHRSTNTEESA